MYRRYNTKFIYDGKEVRIIDIAYFNRIKSYVIDNKLYDTIQLNGADIRSISYMYYGSVCFDWLIYIVNDIVDIYRYNVNEIKVPYVHVINMLSRL